jgi:hypothetical protein
MFADAKVKKTYIGIDRFSQWIGTIERFLQYEQWVKDVDDDECHTETSLAAVERYIPMLVERFKNTVERKAGLGTKFIKLHLLSHQIQAHRKFGKLANTDTSFGETRHKFFAKQPGKQTQRRKETFDKEVANRNVDAILLTIGLTVLSGTANSNLAPTQALNLGPRVWKREGYMYIVTAESIRKHAKSTCYLPVSDTRTLDGVSEALQVLQHHILPQLQAIKELNTYHTIVINETAYRCCPNYKQRPWYDWATVITADGNTTATMRFLLAFDQPDDYEEVISFNQCSLSNQSTYILGYFLDGTENEYRTHAESEMFFFSQA